MERELPSIRDKVHAGTNSESMLHGSSMADVIRLFYYRGNLILRISKIGTWYR